MLLRLPWKLEQFKIFQYVKTKQDLPIIKWTFYTSVYFHFGTIQVCNHSQQLLCITTQFKCGAAKRFAYSY